MYEGNQREIDFGSSKREVRVSEGSSYRESTVFLTKFQVFHLTMKHCVECLILLLKKKKDFKRRN